MVVEALAAGLGGANMLWKYNRGNYMYDREMRLKQEFQVMGWRTEAAELWRDDIREIVGLTEKRMDIYLLVSALQLDMCVGLFCEGRMEPGTPPWLLNLYMLTLGGAFMYLLLAIWLAMHAAVVAQCSSVRLLTQFVRLPVPTWPHLEAARTYAADFEEMRTRNMLRVPFAGKEKKPSTSAPPASSTRAASSRAPSLPAAAEAKDSTNMLRVPFVIPEEDAITSASPAASAGASSSRAPSSLVAAAEGAPPPLGDALQAGDGSSSDMAAPEHVDTWDIERHRSDIYELMRTPSNLAHHIGLAKKAAQHYQCYDAFARVAMSFGTNQLLSAITYFAMGYCTVQDQAMSAAWFVFVIMISIACALIELDVSLTRKDRMISQVLIIVGPFATTIALYAWMQHAVEELRLVRIAYISHFLWLLFALRKLKVVKQPNGSLLPIRFRPTLYLDIFGWLRKERKKKKGVPGSTRGYEALANHDRHIEDEEMEDDEQDDEESEEDDDTRRSGIYKRARSDIALLKKPGLFDHMEPGDRDRVERLAKRLREREARLQAKLKSRIPKSRKSKSKHTGAVSKTTSEQPESLGRSKLVRFKGASDDGAEHAYYVDAESGEVIHEADEQSAPLLRRREARSITQAERRLDSLEEEGENDDDRKQEGLLKKWMVKTAEPLDWGGVSAPQFMKRFPNLAAAHDLELEAEDDEEHPDDMFDIFATFPHAGGDIAVMNETSHASPGKTPWKLFRLGTLSLAFLWAVSIVLPIRLFKVVGSKGPKPFVPEEEIGDFGPGAQLPVGWPTHWGFMPRALSSDASGRRILVADDFGIFTLKLPDVHSQVQANSSIMSLLASAERSAERGIAAASSLEHRLAMLPSRARAALRGTSVNLPPPRTIATFEREPICSSLEDQALDDVDLLCPTDMGASCQALILHGSNLTICPLGTEAMESHAEKARTWTISQDWLDSDAGEEIQSAAMNKACVRQSATDPLDLAATTTSGGVSCVVVGTTTGRVVQLRPNLVQANNLVPERAMQQHAESHPVSHGTIHIFEGRLVMVLRPKLGTVQVLCADEGLVVGEWRLPKDVQWSALCGGGGSLYFLGRAKKAHFGLWRFPVPSDLEERSALRCGTSHRASAASGREF